MAVVATGIVSGYDWQSEQRFKVRLSIYAGEDDTVDVLTQESFSVEDVEAAVNAGIHSFIQAYLLSEWAIAYAPATDTIEIINPYRKAGVSAALSSVKLMAFWKLDEDTGTPRADSVGSNHFTEVGTVLQGVGKVGSSAAFQDDGGHLVIAGSPDLVSGDFDLTFAFWMKPTGGGTAPIFSSWDSVLDSEVYGLWWNVDGTIELHVHNGTTLDVYTTSLVPPMFVWTFFRVWYSAADSTWTISMAGESLHSFVAIPLTTSDKFALGGCDAGAGAYLSGEVDAFGYWRRLLSDAGAVTLYNNGAGQEFPFAEVVPPAVPLGTGFAYITAGVQETDALTKVQFGHIEEAGPFTVLANITSDPAFMFDATISDVLDLLTGAADGDIIYRSGGTWTVLPKGTAGQVLTMNAGGTAPEWQTP